MITSVQIMNDKRVNPIQLEPHCTIKKRTFKSCRGIIKILFERKTAAPW
jgi:hypothetical protein